MQSNNLWHKCFICEDKCCKKEISSPLFLISNERERLPKINTSYPCSYFDKEELCEVYKERPYDCRFFPFDIANLNNKLFWIYWNINCMIIDEKIFEPYLREHEQNLIPQFTNYLGKYAEFRFEELYKKYSYNILREVKIDNL